MRRATMLGASVFLLSCSSPSNPPAPNPTPKWQVVLNAGLDRAVLSVGGTGPSDVYAVGGPLENPGFETLTLHYDGNAWTSLKPGGTETFWWVHAVAPNDAWMVGTGGRIAHWDGKAFQAHDSGTKATLWGVWGKSPSDVWAVGGSPGDGTKSPNDIVLHYDGSKWTPEKLPDAPLGVSLFKVWGTASDNLYVVGESGTIWHRKGTTWTLESKPPIASGTLFTVFGCSATEVYAVGGNDVLLSAGTSWKKLTVDLSSGVNGVSCNAPGQVAIVGFGGLKQRLVSGKWLDEFDVEPYGDLHATWADGQGAFWAVGGDWTSKPSSKARAGMIGRFGAGAVSTKLP